MESNIKTPKTATGLPMSVMDQWIVKIGNVVGWLYLIAVAISIFEVFMRYGFNRPTSWVHEITLMLVGIGMLWGGAHCMAEDRHIRVTVIRDALSPRIQALLDFIVGILNLLFCSGLSWAGFIMAKKSLFDPTGVFRMQRSGSAFNSPAPAVVKSILFIVLVLMTLQAIQQLWTKLKRLKTSLMSQSPNNQIGDV